MLLGAIGRQAGELLQYTATWHHGHAMMRFLPARVQAEAKTTTKLPKYGGFEFKNGGFEFYKHPPAEAYNVNRLLFDVRHDAGLRRRLLTDPDSVALQYELDAVGQEAAHAVATVGQTARVSDNAAILVKAGAHPLQALMSLHAVHAEMKRLQSELTNP